MARHLITSALPYINGIKHLGNLVGSQLPSDVYARYLRLRGHEVLHVCATDEHGTPAELAAAESKLPVQEYCDRMHQRQKALADAFRLDFDWFGRSSRPPTHRLTQHLAGRLADAGLIREVAMRQPYSPTDRRFLPDRFVLGTCPACGYERARGDQCENCTKQLDPDELVRPRSAISGATDLEFRESRHLFLAQSAMRERLRAWVDARTDWPLLSRSIAFKWLNDGDGLQDRCITRDLDWGVPVRRGEDPWPGMEDKVFYVWFDAPIAYIGATVEWAEATGQDWRRWWREDQGAGDVRYTQFMAKDNIPFHALSFPATLMGSGEPWKQVDLIKGFNWLTFDGGKFSTSLQRGVFMDGALDILPADCWRWWLISHAPESGDSDFTWPSLRDGVNRDLADVLGNFASRVGGLVASRFAGRTPEGGHEGEAEAALREAVLRRLDAYEAAMDAVEFRRATTELRAMWSLGNEYLQRAEPWAHVRSDRPRAAVALRVALQLVHLYAVVSAPLIPDAAATLCGIFGRPAPAPGDWPEDRAAAFTAIPPGHPVERPAPLIRKITEDDLDAWQARFGGDRGEATPG